MSKEKEKEKNKNIPKEKEVKKEENKLKEFSKDENGVPTHRYIKFHSDVVNKEGVCTFEKDKVYPIPTENGSADRWIKRGHLEVTVGEEQSTLENTEKSEQSDNGAENDL